MSGIKNTYDSDLLIEDLSSIFKQYTEKVPALISLIGEGEEARNTTVKWLEGRVSPTSTAITSFATDGDGVGITVADASGIRAGAILYFEKANGLSVTEQVKVTAVSGNNLTVSRVYGGTTAATLAVSDVAKLLSRPRAELEFLTPENGTTEPDVQYNYTERFFSDVTMSQTLIDVAKYGSSTPEEYINSQVENAAKDVMWQLNRALIHGRRVERSASENGSMGGVIQYISGGEGVVTAGGGAITPDLLNRVFEVLYANGGNGGKYFIVGAVNQTKKVSAFNSTANNVTRTTGTGDTVYQQSVDTFISSIQGGARFEAHVFTDAEIPRDMLLVLNVDLIKFRPLTGINYMDRSIKSYTGIHRTVETERTLEVRGGHYLHGMIQNLSL